MRMLPYFHKARSCYSSLHWDEGEVCPRQVFLPFTLCPSLGPQGHIHTRYQ